MHGIGQRAVTRSDKDVRDAYNTNLYKWFRELSERMRYVRVVNGEWNRVCSGNWQDNCGNVGIFFDPPYAIEDRTQKIYHHDDTNKIAHDVRDWCIERGKIKTYKIILAGYDEHNDLLNHGWTVRKWKATGGYGNSAEGQGKENSHREVLYFSPHCIVENVRNRPAFFQRGDLLNKK